MLTWLRDWWDGVELWLTQLWFPFQFALVLMVLLPVCLGLAWLIDRVVDFVSGLFGRDRLAEPQADYDREPGTGDGVRREPGES
ncbi:MAG: hypothetical protein GEU98_21350 [Pseudonocardiaceae bacterium]|nr:hypothetical protein [Pseudonocardiaceae bacterium]